ncbi:unnamed protein product [Microthlaspi erraticum]|uniref:Aspartic peptidase DDI1-type domain-containing protein n=2 Tax=Microthlaspi erraticum TaxID=1685480 RepID=A0A6D2KVM0_9BRAS|nr:unnamed protein product [Microthlaspi erraticum]
MNHNTNIHFGNRTLIPHDLHGRSYQDPAVSIVPHPFPPNRAHPTFEGPSRDEHHYHHHQNRPPVYHQPPRPVLHSHHDHVLNRRRDSHFDAVLEGFMESQRRTSRDIETKLEFTRYELDGRLGELSTQIERVESRCLDMEEDLKKQGEAIEDNRRAIHFTKVSTKEMDNHLDEKISSLDNNLDGTTKSLNSITAVAHQAKREVAEVTLKERQCYSTMLTLVEGQKQVKAQIRDLHISLDKRSQDIQRRARGLEDKVDGVSKEVKDLTTRLANLEEKVLTETKTTVPKQNYAAPVFTIRETDPRVIWDEEESRADQERATKLTTGTREKIAPKGRTLTQRSSQPPPTKEKRKIRSSLEEIIDDFNFMARRFPYGVTFDNACNKSPFMQDLAWTQDWSLAEMEKMYEEARKGMPKPRFLHKLHDPGYFLIHFSINGSYFDDALCDSGSSVNLMPAEIAKKLGLINSIVKSRMDLKLADSSLTEPLGEVKDIQLDFGGCIVPANFYVVTMKDPEDLKLLLGRSFLATAGAIMDWPNRRISLANVDKDTFYDAAPPGFSSKRFRYTSGGECSQVRGESHGYLIKEVLQDKMHLESSGNRKFLEPPILPN